MNQSPNSPKIGEAVADFVLPLCSGGDVSLESLLLNKRGVVVVFWSGICSHCVRYDEYLNEFCDLHPDIGLAAIACRQGETLAQVQGVIEQRRLSFPVLFDSDRRLAHQWSIQTTPTALLLDAGRVATYRGPIDNYKYPQEPDYRPYLEQAIAAWTAGRPVERPEIATFGCAVESVYYTLSKPFLPATKAHDD